jgi:hypothetical protein
VTHRWTSGRQVGADIHVRLHGEQACDSPWLVRSLTTSRPSLSAEAQAAPDLGPAGALAAQAAPAEALEAVTAEAAVLAADVASELSSLDALSSMDLDDEAADGSPVLPLSESLPVARTASCKITHQGCAAVSMTRIYTGCRRYRTADRAEDRLALVAQLTVCSPA